MKTLSKRNTLWMLIVLGAFLSGACGNPDPSTTDHSQQGKAEVAPALRGNGPICDVNVDRETALQHTTQSMRAIQKILDLLRYSYSNQPLSVKQQLLPEWWPVMAKLHEQFGAIESELRHDEASSDAPARYHIVSEQAKSDLATVQIAGSSEDRLDRYLELAKRISDITVCSRLEAGLTCGCRPSVR